MVVKFTPLVVKFTPIGVCNLVGMTAEFGTLGGILIGYSLVWFDFCCTALRHILGNFGRGQLT